MKNSKLLFFILLFLCVCSIHAQSIQSPSLTHKKTKKTLIIDSIPVIKPNKLAINNISHTKLKDRYSIFFNSFQDYPSSGFANYKRQVINTKNAFNHKSLFDPLTYNNRLLNSWDNPTGQESFGAGVLVGTLILIFDLLPD